VRNKPLWGWFERLIAHAAELLASGAPVALAGDDNVMPSELDVYKPERRDALFRASRSAKLLAGSSPRLDGCAFRTLLGWTLTK
jgi:exonuclease III